MRGEEFHCFHHNLVQFGQRHPQDDYRLTAWHFSDDLRRRYQAAIDDVLAETGGDVFALKISTLSQQVDFICSLFPDARFIQMIRDGRDVACSMDDLRVALSSSGDGERLLGPAADPLGLSFACAFGTDGERGILNAAASWFFHIASSYLDLGFAAPERCLRVHYESLVTDHHNEIGRILGFLSLDSSDAVLKLAEAVSDLPGGQRTPGFSTTETRSGGRVGRFQRDLSSPPRGLIASLLELPLVTHGYQADDPPSRAQLSDHCAELGIDIELWGERVGAATKWFTLHKRAFDPSALLRQDSRPSLEKRPLLVFGAHAEHRQQPATAFSVRSVGGDGGYTSVHKQERRLEVADPTCAFPRITARLDGSCTVGEIVGDAEPGCDVTNWLQQLHERGFLAWV